MRFCGECGAALAAHAGFCPDCGTPARAASTPPAAPPAAAPAAGPGVPPVVDSAPPFARPAPLPPSRTTSPYDWLRSRRTRILSRVFLTMALIGAGILVGWAFGADQSLVEADPVTASPSSTASPVPIGATSMPDLRGLSAADSRQILADVSVPASAVSVVAQPAAGEAGVVLGQEPVYGYPVEGVVTLSVSTAAKVPQFRGREATDVLADLDELGAEVRTVSRYVPGVAVGDVAAITPAPGTLLPVAVTVVVAAEPDVLALVDVYATVDSCYTDSDSLNGRSYNNLLTCSADRQPVSQTWVIKRAASRLSGTIGVPDSGAPGDSLQLEVIADGRVLTTLVATYGSTTPFELDVSGVLRLSLRYRSLTRDYATLGLAQLRLLGDQAQLKRLETY